MSYASSDVAACEEKIGYRFKNRQLLVTALTHSSCANTHLESNERLEFLGDATLGMIVASYLYRRFPEKTEGELSKLKSVVVSRLACRRVALQLGLDRFLKTGKGLTRLPNSLVSNVMEAVIGAILLDGGIETTTSFVESHFQQEVDDALNAESIEAERLDSPRSDAIEVLEDFKSLLQIETQRLFPNQKPAYIQLAVVGPDHEKSFLVATEVNGKRYQSAWGKSKKEAEQRAAGNALLQLKGHKPPFH